MLELIARSLGLANGDLTSIGEGYAVLLTGILVIIGWYITHRSATNLARNSTANDYIISSNKDINDLIVSLARYLQTKQPFPDPFVESTDRDQDGRLLFVPNRNSEDLVNIKRLLTSMEIIANDIRFGLVSEKYILSAQRSLIVNLFRVSKRYISNVRTVRNQPTAFENFEVLFIRCEYEKYNFLVKILEYALNRPNFRLSAITFKIKYNLALSLNWVSSSPLIESEDKIKLAIEKIDKWVLLIATTVIFIALYLGGYIRFQY